MVPGRFGWRTLAPKSAKRAYLMFTSLLFRVRIGQRLRAHLVAVVAGVLLARPGAAQTWQWVTPIGTPAAYVSSTIADNAGNTYLSGAFTRQLAFPNTPPIFGDSSYFRTFVTKLNPAGDMLWTKVINGNPGGGVGATNTNVLALDPAGNVLLATTIWDSAYFDTTLVRSAANGASTVLAKLDGQTGDWLWVTPAVGPGRNSISSIAVSPVGDVVVTGQFVDSVQLGSTRLVNVIRTGGIYSSLFVAGLSGNSGTWSFARCLTGEYNTDDAAVCADASGNVYLSATYSSLNLLSLGGFTLPAGAGPTKNSFVAKLNPLLGWQWVSALANTRRGDDVRCRAMTWNRTGRLVVAGSFNHTVTIGATTLQGSGLRSSRLFVAEIDTSGAWRWATDNGAEDGSLGSQLFLAKYPAGGVVIAGKGTYGFGPLTFTPTTPAYQDVFVALLDSARQWRWAVQARGSRGRVFNDGLAVDGAGQVTIAGYAESDSSFSFGSLVLADSGLFGARLSLPVVGLPAEARAAPPLQLWPNPAATAAHVRGGRGPATVRDALGRLVAMGPPDAADATADLLLDLRGLPAGFYIVQRGLATQRLLVSL